MRVGMNECVRRLAFTVDERNPDAVCQKGEVRCVTVSLTIVFVVSLLTLTVWTFLSVLMPAMGVAWTTLFGPLVGTGNAQCPTSLANATRVCVYDFAHCQCLLEGLVTLLVLIAIAITLALLALCVCRLKYSLKKSDEIDAILREGKDCESVVLIN